MKDYYFVILVSDYMAVYTLKDLEKLDNVIVYNKAKLSNNFLLNYLYKTMLSVKINSYIKIPFKEAIFNLLFQNLSIKQNNLCFIISPAWFTEELIFYINKKFPNAYLVMSFQDTVEAKLRTIPMLKIEYLKTMFDLVVVYNELDSFKYKFEYCPMGYSVIDPKFIKSYPKSDICFIGAAKNRLDDIRKVYKKFRDSGYNCFFYITGVNKSERLNDGIIYADKNMSFIDYISREIASECLLEIVQRGSTGRTYRMMEAAIYNKKLITNCPEIKNEHYYTTGNCAFFNDIEEIDTEFINKITKKYVYKYEYSPIKYIDFIKSKIILREG